MQVCQMMWMELEASSRQVEQNEKDPWNKEED
jgi:hypothetical protein